MATSEADTIPMGLRSAALIRAVENRRAQPSSAFPTRAPRTIIRAREALASLWVWPRTKTSSGSGCARRRAAVFVYAAEPSDIHGCELLTLERLSAVVAGFGKLAPGVAKVREPRRRVDNHSSNGEAK